MTTTRTRARTLVAILALAGLLLAACGNSGDDGDAASGSEEPAAEEPGGEVAAVDAPGVTDDEIRFAAFGTQANNPLGTCVLDCYSDGIRAYFAFRNAEGGVHGRELVLSKTLDDQLSKNKEMALQVVADDDVFAAFSATQIASGWADVADAGIPLYVWNIHPVEIQHEEIFGQVGAICTSCTSRIGSYLAKDIGATKVAALGYGISENSKVCSQTIKKSFELYKDDNGGAEVVYLNDNLAFGLPNGVGPEVSAMKRAGVDFVSACIDLNGMKTLAQELERQGMGDVPMYHPNTYDQAFVADAGDLFEGDFVGVSFRPFEASSGQSGQADYKKWIEETGGQVSELSMIGWINADTAYQGILAAGEDFSREKVIAATNAMEDYTAGGLVFPVDFARQHIPPTQEDPATNGYEFECTAVVRVVDGKFELYSKDDSKPWVCWPNATRDWVEPEFMDFE